MEKYIPVVSAVTALVAVFIGPLITLYVANRQIRANILGVSRQQWINTLRDELSNYLAAMAVAGARSTSLTASDEDHMISLEELCRLESKIRMLLNPNESDHSQLISLLRQTSASVFIDNVHDVTQIPEISADYREKVISKSQEILKKEWNRVKSLD